MNTVFRVKNSKNESINFFSDSGIKLEVKREDLIHPIISGNKYRKLKYNIIEAQKRNVDTILTFGGAFSNHITATAAVGKEFGFKTIGIIRGEELVNKINNNPTLKYAQHCGMKLKFVSREAFRDKKELHFIKLLEKEFGDFYSLPEGGTNNLATKGCEEILNDIDKSFDYICTSVGTGGTVVGLINCSKPSQQVLGFSALKGDFLNQDISKFAKQDNWELITNYHFGGYAKINVELITFINRFKAQNNIQLDPIYTGKMMFGIMDMIKKGYFPKGSKILAIHTGGLQGITGMNSYLKKKQLPLIQ